MQPNEVLTDGFEYWLGYMSSNKFPWGRRLDPFGTSLRKFDRVGSWLEAIEVGDEPTANTSRMLEQLYVDLKGMQLISREKGQQAVLTELGRLVVADWREWNLVTGASSEAEEIARSVLFLKNAFKVSDFTVRRRYLEMYYAWARLVRLQSAEYWFKDPIRMMLPSYLDQPDDRGYVPFTVFEALCSGDLGESVQWDEWGRSSWSGASDLKRMLEKILTTHRIGGGRAFRQSLHVLYTVNTQPEVLPKILNDWQIEL